MQETTPLLGLDPHFFGPIQLNPLQQTEGCLHWKERSHFARVLLCSSILGL